MSARADALAARIELGADGLAEFAQTLTDAEWKTRVPHDGRTVGVTVHHVASVYPIEIQLARSIAGGKAVTDVTWDGVSEMNAKHASEHATATKAEAIAFLREKSREAAAAVRAFSDAELDTAAAFSLSYGAIVTAQFVVEDHAVRHSWHHLARLRAAVAR